MYVKFYHVFAHMCVLSTLNANTENCVLHVPHCKFSLVDLKEDGIETCLQLYMQRVHICFLQSNETYLFFLVFYIQLLENS